MIKFDEPQVFNHHRSGWNFCKNLIKNYSDPSGILCINYADGFFGKGEFVKEPWIGFFHNTPFHPENYRDIYDFNLGKNGATNPLSNLICLPNFRQSLKYCYGIFTLCNYTTNYFKNRIKVDVETIYHPTEFVETQFDINKFKKNSQVYTIGHWMRNFQSTYDIISPYPKYILDIFGILEKINLEKNNSVTIVSALKNSEYDELLSRVIVFIDLFDVAACNTIIECIVRNTPIITRRLAASEEYLGKNYPLFFESFSEIESVLKLEKIIEAHKYLLNMNKDHIDGRTFQKSFSSSNIFTKIKKKSKIITMI